MLIRFSLFVCLILTISSCKKNETAVPDPFMNALADGTLKKFDRVTGAITSGNLQITGQSSTGSATMVLYIYAYTPGQLGSFTISNAFYNTALFSENNSSFAANRNGGSGKIDIVRASATSIQGNFEFTGLTGSGASKVITQGSFSVNL